MTCPLFFSSVLLLRTWSFSLARGPPARAHTAQPPLQLGVVTVSGSDVCDLTASPLMEIAYPPLPLSFPLFLDVVLLIGFNQADEDNTLKQCFSNPMLCTQESCLNVAADLEGLRRA